VLAASAFQLARRLSLLDFECLLFGFAIFGVNDNKLSRYCQPLFIIAGPAQLAEVIPYHHLCITSVQVLLQPWQSEGLRLLVQPEL